VVAAFGFDDRQHSAIGVRESLQAWLTSMCGWARRSFTTSHSPSKQATWRKVHLSESGFAQLMLISGWVSSKVAKAQGEEYSLAKRADSISF